ncbi:hypothetical protein [Enterobacter cloacae complex sp. 357B1]|uniref:hypothetical protein n=1 Tax=Enterobacter cloacae complex sp. 357B1 TaxID=3395827 RepID=UPI003CF998D6
MKMKSSVRLLSIKLLDEQGDGPQYAELMAEREKKEFEYNKNIISLIVATGKNGFGAKAEGREEIENLKGINFHSSL